MTTVSSLTHLEGNIRSIVLSLAVLIGAMLMTGVTANSAKPRRTRILRIGWFFVGLAGLAGLILSLIVLFTS
jgi:hypothetical protein